MALFTPMKGLDSNLAISKLSIKQATSQQLRVDFLQKQLQMRNKKFQSYQQQMKQQQDKIQQLEQAIAIRDKDIKNKNQIIQQYKQKIIDMEEELARKIGELVERKRDLSKKEVQLVRDKQGQENNQKLNRVLTKQNSQLISEHNRFKKTIADMTEILAIKDTELLKQIQNAALVTRLNQQLKLQVQQLLFQIRMANRKQQKNTLINYEDAISLRAMRRNNYNDNNDEVKQSGEKQEDQTELVELLKLKVESLEQQLAISDRRCKQLQGIILAQ